VSDDGERRRTELAIERTYLAWWRTGMTGYAVALATARLVPDLAKSKHHWPYTLIGLGFAVLGTGCIVYGERRRRAGVEEDMSQIPAVGLTLGGVLLGFALAVVLLVEP
jgi:putative membrane protein